MCARTLSRIVSDVTSSTSGNICCFPTRPGPRLLCTERTCGLRGGGLHSLTVTLNTLWEWQQGLTRRSHTNRHATSHSLVCSPTWKGTTLEWLAGQGNQWLWLISVISHICIGYIKDKEPQCVTPPPPQQLSSWWHPPCLLNSFQEAWVDLQPLGELFFQSPFIFLFSGKFSWLEFPEMICVRSVTVSEKCFGGRLAYSSFLCRTLHFVCLAGFYFLQRRTFLRKQVLPAHKGLWSGTQRQCHLGM